MIAYPQYVAGNGQFDTELMVAARGNLAAKAGAEGVHGVGAIAQAVGYVSKVLDGSSRARAPSTIACLRRLGIIDSAIAGRLGGFASPTVYNRAGHAVGEIRVAANQESA
jgi:L-asparaginase